MTNKTKTILCVCALTASAFAWNATAEDEVSLPGYVITNPDNGVEELIVNPDGAYGIYDDPYHGGYKGYNPEGYRYGYPVYQAKGAWGYNMESTDSVYTAVENQSVLSFSIERNITDNGFKFGTYTVDSTGGIHMEELGTVTQKGWVGVTEMKDKSGNLIMDDNGNPKTLQKIAIDPTNPDYDYKVESVYSDAFTAQTLVGVWMQELKDNAPIYYSQNELTTNDENNAGRLTDLSSLPADKQIFTIGDLDGLGNAFVWFDDAITVEKNGDITPGWPGQDVEYEPAFVKIRITGAAPGFAGKVGPKIGGPLPGVWATIALAGAASTYLKRRRKENK